jgi:DNA-directed RNA polymerase subunit E'/Rpb7
MDIALEQAKEARLHILGEMAKVISRPREKMSEWAPTIMTLKIDPEKIRDVIGKGGAVIRAITEETGATVDIDNDGTVRIASVDGASGKEARRRIELITADVEVGRIYEGKVARLMDFGAFVTILPGKDGLVHISQISNERVEKVSDKLAEGDVVKVKVLEVDRQPDLLQDRGRGPRERAPAFFMSEPRAGEVRFEKARDSFREVEVWPPGTAAINEGDVAAMLAHLERDAVGKHVRLRYHIGCHERIIHRVHDQGRALDEAQETDRACPVIVIVHPLEPMQRRRHDVVELGESPGSHRFVPVECRGVAVEFSMQCVLHAF